MSIEKELQDELVEGVEANEEMLEAKEAEKEVNAEQGRLAQERIKEHFNWSKIAQQYLEAFESLK